MNKQLLYQYFAGKATLLEKSRIEEWLNDPNNQEYFYQVLEEWERNNTQYEPNKENLWKLIDQKTSTNNNRFRHLTHFPDRKKILNRRRWSMIAASILILCVSGYLFRDTIAYRYYSTSYGETMILSLADRSEIILNANSTLKLPRLMKHMNDRQVWVQGEAFFEISRTSDLKKFVVHTAQMDVEVLGTRFNVNDRNESTRVVLEEGSVKVVSNQERSEVAYLEKPGDYAELTSQNNKIITKSVDQSLYTSWAENRLKFDNAPLPHVIKSIEDFYGVTIIVPDSTLLHRNYTGTLPNDNMEVILKALSNIYDADFTSKENGNKAKPAVSNTQ